MPGQCQCPAMGLLLGREPEAQAMMVGLARAEDGIREIRVVRRVREILGFETKAGTGLVAHAAFSWQGIVEEIPTVEVDGGLVGEDVHDAAALGVFDAGGVGEPGGVGLIEDPAGIVAVGELQGFEVFVQTIADGGGLEEVHRGAVDAVSFPGGDESGVGGKVVARGETELVIVNQAALITTKVPVGVMHDVDRSGGVGGGADIPLQCVVLGQHVAHSGGHGAGIAFFAGGGDVFQGDGGRVVFDDGPEPSIEADGASVEMAGYATWIVVGGELMGHALDLEPAVGDAVAEAPNRSSVIRVGIGVVRLDRVVAEHDVGKLAIAICDLEADQGGAEVADDCAGPMGVDQAETAGCNPVGKDTERGAGGGRRGLGFHGGKDSTKKLGAGKGSGCVMRKQRICF